MRSKPNANFLKIDASQILTAAAAAFSLVTPLLIGVLSDHTKLGALSSLGALALSGEVKGETFKDRITGIIYGVTAAAAAVLTGTALGGHGAITGISIAFIAAIAGTIGSFNRQLVRAATLFILFTVITSHLDGTRENPFLITTIFLSGAVWISLILLGLRSVFKIKENIPQSPKYSMTQYFNRWRKSLAVFSGWRYTIKLFLCLLAAALCEILYPVAHVYWVALTVVLVLQRKPEMLLKRTFERSLGTIFGIILSGALLLWQPNFYPVIVMVVLLAAAKAIFRETNYLAYITVMTPLVIILLDFGQSATISVIATRLLATLVGSFIVFLLGYLIWKKE